MVWVLACTVNVGYGVLFYVFAVFLVPMRAELGATTGQLSGALSLSIAVNGAAAVLVGRHLDRHGARWLTAGGSLLGAAAVVAWSQAQDLLQLYVAFVGVGLAGAAVMYEPAFALVTRWFDRDRSAALLTLTVVAGFSATVFVPLGQALIDALGWRQALLVLAAVLGACAVPQAVLLRRAPEDLGLGVDGDPPGTHQPPADEQQTPAQALAVAWRLRSVRLLTAAAVLEMVAITVIAVHLVAYLRDTGVAATTAAWVAGAIGVFSVVGRILVTALAERTGLALLATVMVAAQALGIAGLALPRPFSLVLFVVLFGTGFGVMTIARAALLSRYVPVRVFGSVSGRQALATGGGRVVAPVAAGVLITTVGYPAALSVVALCAVGSGALLLLAERAHAQVRVPAAVADASGWTGRSA